eukprot:gene18189-16258_t
MRGWKDDWYARPSYFAARGLDLSRAFCEACAQRIVHPPKHGADTETRGAGGAAGAGGGAGGGEGGIPVVEGLVAVELSRDGFETWHRLLPMHTIGPGVVAWL